jgi:hypothetical protein
MARPNANPNLLRKHNFKKGDKKPPGAGRARGTPNKRTAILRDAILQAAELVGQDGKGKNGLTGYLMMLAQREKAVYARLLEKVLPMQVRVRDETTTYTPAEAAERLRERGLPVPASLLSLPGPASVADRLRGGDGSVLHLVEEDYERELSGEDEDEEE